MRNERRLAADRAELANTTRIDASALAFPRLVGVKTGATAEMAAH